MKTARILTSVAGLAFVAGLWTACSIGFDPTSDEHQFSCTTDQDCVSPNACLGGVCVPRNGPGACTDADGDGYGVGDTASCPECQSADKCAEDCNDNDEAVNPGLLDNCDGKDNNCDGEIDEILTCEDSTDCPDEQPYLVSCDFDTSTCLYKTSLQTADPACVPPVACVGGAREDRPDVCF